MSRYLTYEERLVIEAGQKEKLTFGGISLKLGKDRTTIAKEVKKYSYEKKSGCLGKPYNACKQRSNCTLKGICGKLIALGKASNTVNTVVLVMI